MIDYLLHVFILVLIYSMLGLSLTITVGYPRLISLAHAGFFGIGAYTSAILSANAGLPFIVTLPLSMLFCGVVGLFISIISLRTVDDYFIIVTLGVQIVTFSVLNNCIEITNGPLGLTNIPPISIFGSEIESRIWFLVITIFFSLIVFFLLRNITKSSFGRLLIAVSEDEIFPKSLGKKVYNAKIASFTIGAVLAAIPGALYAHYISCLVPSTFSLDESIFILSIVIIGGLRNLWGTVIAAAILVILPELLRFIGFSSSIAASLRQIIYGFALIILIIKNKEFLLGKTLRWGSYNILGKNSRS